MTGILQLFVRLEGHGALHDGIFPRGIVHIAQVSLPILFCKIRIEKVSEFCVIAESQGSVFVGAVSVVCLANENLIGIVVVLVELHDEFSAKVKYSVGRQNQYVVGFYGSVQSSSHPRHHIISYSGYV